MKIPVPALLFPELDKPKPPPKPQGYWTYSLRLGGWVFVMRPKIGGK